MDEAEIIMAKFKKKKLVIVDAHQWFKNGDHPKDNCPEYCDTNGNVALLGEGRVVRYYRNPNVDGRAKCQHCGQIMCKHGWIDAPEGGHTVCPGDWIITEANGEQYPCKSDIFWHTYWRCE